jgi:predicted tellurium resistance membrane protein TerC
VRDAVVADPLVLLAQVILITLALSGDNALAVALAIRGLSPTERQRAAVVGGGAAILVCVTLAASATLLLRLPGLKLAGGCALVAISALQLRDGRPGRSAERHPVGRGGPILTIFVAELSVSLDNMLGATAVGGGNVLVLVLGLSAGMLLALLGAVHIARLLGRSAWLAVLAAGVVARAGAGLAMDDPVLLERGAALQTLTWLVPGAVMGAGLIGWWFSTRDRRARRRPAPFGSDPSDGSGG